MSPQSRSQKNHGSAPSLLQHITSLPATVMKLVQAVSPHSLPVLTKGPLGSYFLWIRKASVMLAPNMIRRRKKVSCGNDKKFNKKSHSQGLDLRSQHLSTLPWAWNTPKLALGCTQTNGCVGTTKCCFLSQQVPMASRGCIALGVCFTSHGHLVDPGFPHRTGLL